MTTVLVAHVEYEPIVDCHVCQRRPGSLSMSLEGELVGCCETCWERVDDDREPPNYEGREGQPEFNRAFNAW